MGDFNAKIGKPLERDSAAVGPFGLGVRNPRGQTLVNYLEANGLHAMNTFFYKKEKRKWTWISPDGRTKNEIDYILTDRKWSVTDVSVLNRVDSGSDHRLVRGTLRLNLAMERRKPLAKLNVPDEVAEDFEAKLEDALSSAPHDENVDIDRFYSAFVSTLRDTAEKHFSKSRQAHRSKLSEDTLRLLDKRRNMSPNKRQTVEHRSLNKSINKSIRRDIRRENLRLDDREQRHYV